MPIHLLKGGAYVAGTRYKSGDYTPYLFKTKDYGVSWELITTGIDADHFTRVVRADPDRKGLLYCGTETGMYISFDDGASWQSFQRNLPIVPITDLTIKNKNLIAATQGRSFWMIDDISPLHQLSVEIANSNFHLYKPQDSYRMDGSSRRSRTAGQNHPGGVLVNFYVASLSDSTEVSLEFSDDTGKVIKTLSNHAADKKDSLAVESGTNQFVWNMQYEDAKKFDGMILWWASTSGPKAIPGSYHVKLKVDGDSSVQSFDVLKDPRIKSTDKDLERQFVFLMEIRDKLSEAHQAIINIRKVNSQISGLKSRLNEDDHASLMMEIDTLEKALNSIEENLYQTKNKSNQDPLNYPIRLTNKLGHLAALNGYGTFAPTQQELELKQELFAKIDAQLASFLQIEKYEIPKLNARVLALKIPYVEVAEEK
jgi:hypothetical protein